MTDDIDPAPPEPTATTGFDTRGYVLDAQVGFLLRKAYQRNSLIFADLIPHECRRPHPARMFADRPDPGALATPGSPSS